ncbi:MAG: hypothetical protein U0Y10_23495 [Spirosomataceae bacterium]
MPDKPKPMPKDQAVTWSKQHKARKLGKTTSFLAKRELLEALLADPTTEGVRIYLGNHEGEIKLMMASQQTGGNVNTQEVYGGDNTIAPCPPECGWPPNLE